VRKYRRLYSWDERLRTIEKKTQKKLDESEVDRRVRHVKLLQVLQKELFDVIQPKDQKNKDVMRAADAARTLIAAIEAERKICGDVDTKQPDDIDLINVTVNYV
jgi:hypothetical protein